MAQPGGLLMSLFLAVLVQHNNAVGEDTWHFTGPNVAKKKPARQKSTYDGHDANRTVDGFTNNTGWPLQSCSHTDNTAGSWWGVDLQNYHVIKGIRIYNRIYEENAQEKRLQNFTVSGQTRNNESNQIYNDYKYNKYRMNVINISVSDTKAYNVINITVPGPYLTLCEVQIFAVSCTTPTLTEQLRYNLTRGFNLNNTLVAAGSELHFWCEDKHTYTYELRGSAYLECNTTGKFNGTTPKCVRKPCPPPPNITYGQYINKSTVYPGDKLFWKCKSKYLPIGDQFLSCTTSSEWALPHPFCKEMRCSHPGHVEQGKYVFLNNTSYESGTVAIGTEVTVSCERGFKKTGSKRTCTASRSDTVWKGNVSCIRITCGKIPASHGHYNYSPATSPGSKTYVFETTASLICDEDFILSGQSTPRICESSGNWSSDTVSCYAACKTPRVKHGKYVHATKQAAESYASGDILKLKCDSGYEFETDQVGLAGSFITCLENHSWNGTLLNCTEAIMPEASEPEAQTSTPWGAIGGGLGGVIVALLIMLLIVFFVSRKRRSSRAKPSENESAHGVQMNRTGDDDNNDNSEVTETKFAGARRQNQQEHDYYSFDKPMKMPARGIKLEELSDFVLSAHEDHEKYTKEFESFQGGMVKEHKAALQNKDKNRYKNIYAYDETRVVLEVWNSKTETDYINANYIHGFTNTVEYIASQGVTKDTLDDFWRMIWQTDSGKIVMLTNLWEEMKMKCIQYWPDEGTKTFGSVTVTLQDTDTYSNFVIRTLEIKKDQEVARQVLQFHFTAWPDKGVPKYSSALVHFRSKVKYTPALRKGPTIVHCSAGIGRTGTYIALDYLTDQGRELGMVDVAGCVEMMRRQRVNMVQTKDQFVFIHQALVETLMLSTSALPAEKFPNTYRDLLTVDRSKRKRKLDIEFEAIGTMSPAQEEAQYSTARDASHRDKNRYSNILPIEAYMPSLHNPGKAQKDGYINAAFLPSYKTWNAMIITQSPLKTTIEDFWMMMFNQDSRTIVMMNSVAELKESEIYWPKSGQTVTYGAVEVTCQQEKETNGHVVLAFHVKANYEERDIRLIQFGHWGSGMQVPASTSHLLTAIELVQHWQRRSGNHTIVVHCMDGTEKSGLFCVLYALLARTVVEHDVAIAQIIQEMRNRREHVIPNVAQFQFCHEVVLEFLKQFDTYSNFSLI